VVVKELEAGSATTQAGTPTGVKTSTTQFGSTPLTRHDWHGDWNYTIRPS
jgi:hypothetical protein